MRQAWPWPEENGAPEAEGSNTYDERTIRVFAVLSRWYDGMASGEAAAWYPDPDYVRPGGKPPLTEDQVNRVIKLALDEYFNNGANRDYALKTRGIWHDAGPDYGRLAPPQRLALVQQLEGALGV